MNWNEYFIRLAHLVSEKSKDPSTKVGCVLVGPENQTLSTGFNGFPRGVHEVAGDVVVTMGGLTGPYRYVCPDSDDLEELLPDRWERPAKYEFVEHAERNAVYNAARHGITLRGATAYLNWEPHPCIECAKAFIQAGIRRIVGPDRPFSNNKDWRFDTSAIILKEAGVTMEVVPNCLES